MTPPPTLSAADSVSGDGPHEVVVAGPFERVHVLNGLWLSGKDTKLTVRAGGVIILFLALTAAAPERWPLAASVSSAPIAVYTLRPGEGLWFEQSQCAARVSYTIRHLQSWLCATVRRVR